MYVPGREGGMRRIGQRMVDTDHPRVLFIAVDWVTYRPILESPWREACEAAAARIPQIMAEQFVDSLAHAAKKAAAGRCMAA